jgi:hypothetical protein
MLNEEENIDQKNKKTTIIDLITNLVHAFDFVQLLVYIFQYLDYPYVQMDFDHNKFYKQLHYFVDHV